jgi:hypothetical protein
MQDKRKAKSCPRGMNHLLRPPRVSFPPVRRTQGKNREKRKSTHKKPSPNRRERRLDGVQLIMYMNSYPVRKESSKEILEWCLNGILLIPPAYLCLFQKPMSL